MWTDDGLSDFICQRMWLSCLFKKTHCLPLFSTCLQTHLCRGPTFPSTPKCLGTTSQWRYCKATLLLSSSPLFSPVFLAFRIAPPNSLLPSRRPRNTQATPTSITSEELAVVGDHLPCLCMRVCLGAALRTQINSFGRCSSSFWLALCVVLHVPGATSPLQRLWEPLEAPTLGSPKHRTTPGVWTVRQNGQMFSTKLTFCKVFCPSPRRWGTEDRNDEGLF